MKNPYIDQIVAEGADACSAGVPVTENPYRRRGSAGRESLKSKSWRYGWRVTDCNKVA